MIFWSTIFIIIFGVLSSLTTADDPCRFVHPSKGVIDLTSLARHDGQAAYQHAMPPEGGYYTYSYNPCKPFSEQNTVCLNVAICQVTLDDIYGFILGTQDSAKWNPGTDLDELPSISYSHKEQEEKYDIVQLVCSTDGVNRFEVLGESPKNTYTFRLTHKCACWNGCGGHIPQQNCSINGSVYTSDKQIIQSLPFHVTINPSQPSPSNSNYAVVDINEHVIELNLVNIGNIPAAVFCLSQLKVLSLQHTIDLSIPPEIIRLAPSLTSFSMLSNTKSVVLPPELFQMNLLSTLTIVNCGVETLPEDIVRLTQLTELILDQNQLITLPPVLSRMPSLTTLSVKDNPRLSSLDAITGSTSLIILRAANCMINHLPTNIPNLHTIELGGNQLSFLDGLETITSESCILLEFGNNKITSIPDDSFKNVQTLLYLDLPGNQLTTLPNSIYRINDLTTINIRNNSFDVKEKEWIEGLFRLTKTIVII